MKGFLLCLSGVCLLVFCSCGKVDKNGELGGFWKLVEVEYVADGSKKDYSNSCLFMAVQLELMEFRGNGSHFARFRHDGDSLFIQMIGNNADDKLLKSFGLDGQRQCFFVRKLNGKGLIIESIYSKLKFIKY